MRTRQSGRGWRGCEAPWRGTPTPAAWRRLRCCPSPVPLGRRSGGALAGKERAKGAGDEAPRKPSGTRFRQRFGFYTAISSCSFATPHALTRQPLVISYCKPLVCLRAEACRRRSPSIILGTSDNNIFIFIYLLWANRGGSVASSKKSEGMGQTGHLRLRKGPKYYEIQQTLAARQDQQNADESHIIHFSRMNVGMASFGTMVG